VAALFGTDRRPLRPELLPVELAGPASRLSGAAAAVLLDTAALAVAYRRGGFRLDPGCAATDPAAEEEMPRVGRRAGARLSELLTRTDLELVEYWCVAAARAGVLAPEALLPALLDLAARQPVLRPAVGAVLGRRGRWLAAQQRAWARAIPPDQAPGDDPDVWRFGTVQQRAGWLRSARRQDPAAALAQLSSTWPQESGPHRALFLPLLADGLGPADEALLETALDDSRPEVRAVAAGLLSGLPRSGFADRMRSRLKSFIRIERSRLRSRLVVDAPERLDPAAARDTISDSRGTAKLTGQDRRQWWLEQVVALTPLSTWSQLFDSPQASLTVRFGDPWQAPIQAGWAWAAVRQKDQQWARELLRASARYRIQELLAVLTGPARDEALAERIGGLDVREIDVLVSYLGVSEWPWPEPVALAVLSWLEQGMPRMHPMVARGLLNLISYRFPVAAGQSVVDLALTRPLEDIWRSSLLGVTRVISTRAQIHEEFQ
jgi:hypothetical protein